MYDSIIKEYDLIVCYSIQSEPKAHTHTCIFFQAQRMATSLRVPLWSASEKMDVSAIELNVSTIHSENGTFAIFESATFSRNSLLA